MKTLKEQKLNIYLLVLIYIVTGILWISFSDNILLSLNNDFVNNSEYHLYKGWLTLFITSVFMLVLLLWYKKNFLNQSRLLSETENKFKLLFEDAPNPYQSLDSDGKIIAVNKKWLETLGYEKEDEIVGHWFGDMLAPEFVEHFRYNFPRFKEKGSIQGVEFNMLHKDGHPIPVLFHGQIDYDENHSMVQTHCAFEDVSNRHKVEHLYKVLQIIRDVNQAIVRIKNTNNLLKESCSILSSTDLYNYVWIDIVEDNNHELYTSKGEEEKSKAFREKLSQNWTPSCIKKLKTESVPHIFVENTKLSCSECSFRSNQTGENAYVLNLIHEKTSYGYLTVGTTSEFNSDELALLEEVAGDIAYALYNIEIEEQLINNEERLRFVTEKASDGIWDWDLKTNEVYYSPSFKALMGYKDNEMQSKIEEWDSRLHPDDKEQTFLDVDNAINKKTKLYISSFRLKHKDGHWIWIESKAVTLFDKEDKAIRMIGSHRDISSAKKYEKELIELQQFSENIIDSVDNLIFVKDVDSKYITCNKAYEKFVGISRENIIGKSDFDFYDKEMADSFRKYDKEMLIQQKSRANFGWDKDVNGQEYYMLTSKSPLFNSNGEVIGLVGNCSDLTQQNHLYRLLENAEQLVNLGSWKQDFEEDTLIWSSEVYRIFEVNKKDGLTYEKFFNLVHPDDRDSLASTFENSVIQHIEYDTEHRLLFSDGRIKYVHERAQHSYDENGKHSGSIGTVQDITIQKEAEKQLIASEERFKALMHQSPSSVEIYNTEGFLIDMNDAAKNMWNLQESYLYKYNVFTSENVKNKDQLKYLKRAYNGEVVEVDPFEFDPVSETQLEKGRKRWVTTTLYPLKDTSGIVESIVVSHVDITDKIEAEEHAKQHDAMLTSVFDAIPDLLFIMKKDGTITDYRAQTNSALYVEPSVFLGKKIQSVLPEDVGKLFYDNIQSLSKDKKLKIFKYELEIENEIRYYEARVAKLPINEHIMTIVRDITEQTLSELQLEFQATLLEQSLAATDVIDENGVFSYVNKAYVNMWGYDTKEEILETSPLAHCSDPKMPQNIIETVEKEGEHRFMFKALKKDGTTFDALMAVQYFNHMGKKYYMGSTMDITEKQDNLRQLQQKKQELETIIQDAPNPIILYNEDGKILLLNQAWSDSSGFLLEENPTIDDWVDNIYEDIESRNSVKEHIYSLYELTKKSNDGEFTFLNKNRDHTTWQFTSAPLGLIDGKRTIISTAMDITELKQKDEMLINQSRHAAMGEMIGMIAHQWRQPLTVISMNANNMMLDMELDEFNSTKAMQYANDILYKTNYLSETINDFRDFFRPDKTFSKVNIQSVLEDSFVMIRDSLINNHIELKVSYNSELEIETYPRELMQAFVNVITNAKDALILSKKEHPIIQVELYEDETHIIVDISDNGLGIDPQIITKIFDPYFSTKDKDTGTGLGLYMNKMIIEEHLKGRIEAINLDEGTCFRIYLNKS